MQCRPGDESKRPFPRKEEDAEHKVDDLQDREWLYCKVEVLGEEVPEDLRPEEAFKCCCYLVWFLLAREYCPERSTIRTNRGSQYDEPSPVILDEFAHDILIMFPFRISFPVH